MLFQIKSYLIFLWYSKNEHAVHSPFVFNLVTKCFYDKKLKPDPNGSELAKQYQVLKEYRKSLLENKKNSEVNNFDATSKVFKSNTRTAGISPKHAELLFRITNYFQPSTIIEISSSLGLATSALALGNPKTRITSFVNSTNTANVCQLHLQKFNINNVELVVTEFNNYLENCQLKSENCHLIFFDGNLSKRATLDYFELLLPTICNETLWIFNGIHRSADMEEAWKIIKKHRKVTVTIDTFQWGLVFFRREQHKEHFVIRI